MANQEHLDILMQGVEVWNKWREENGNIVPDLKEIELWKTHLKGINLSYTDLYAANLEEVNLQEANLQGANINGTDLIKVNLSRANLREASLIGAYILDANLRKADLREADLSCANIRGTNLSGTDLKGACIEEAVIIRANFTNANLTECYIFGVSVWDVHVEGAAQKDLIITNDEPTITVDNLEVAQFIYLLLHNQKIRDVINTITSKVVLILGRFTDERKPVLNALRNELRKHNYSPIVFDFDPSAKRDLTETVSLLANMSRFVIADITDAKSIPQELESIVPYLPSVPIQPILQEGTREYAMFEHYERYPWMLPIHSYQDIPSLLASIKEHIITPVEQKKDWRDEKRALEEEVKRLEEENRRLKGGK